MGVSRGGCGVQEEAVGFKRRLWSSRGGCGGGRGGSLIKKYMRGDLFTNK